MGKLPFCLPLSLCVGHAALDHELVLVIEAVGIHEGLLVVLVEELLIGQRLDLIVDPVQQGRWCPDCPARGCRRYSRGSALRKR